MPARFRDVLHRTWPAAEANHLVIVPWFEPCVRVYPVRLWDEKQKQFDAAFGDDDIFGIEEGESDFRRFVYGSAIDTSLDANGRILLPADVREHAGIDREVYWVGLGPMLELWDPAVFHERINIRKAPHIRQWLAKGRRPEAPVDGEE